MIPRVPFGPVPGEPVTLVEGGAVYGQVAVESLVPIDELVEWEFAIVTDAPPDQLRIPDSVVATAGAPPRSGFATFPIEALPDGVDEGPQTYSIHLEASDTSPDAIPDDVVAEGVVEIVVVDAQTADCRALGLEARFQGGEREEYPQSGEVRLRAPHPATTIAIRSPYRRFDYPTSVRPYPRWAELSPDSLPFRRTGEGFDTTISLRWLWDLELTAQAPGCPPVGVECRGQSCRSS